MKLVDPAGPLHIADHLCVAHRPEDATNRMRSLVGTVINPRIMEAVAAAISRRKTLVFLSEDLEAEN